MIKPPNFYGQRVDAQAGRTPRQPYEMKAYANRLLLVAAVILGVTMPATSSPLVPQFYKIKVLLSDGRYTEGYSWGVSWIGGASLQERKVKRVVLRVESENVTATFTFFGDDKPVVLKEPAKDQKSRARTLAVSSGYEVFRKGIDFYWVKDTSEYPLQQVLQIDTVEVLGQGYGISDPRTYLNLREPFIVVEDCGLGCEVKMYSKDSKTPRETLQKVWDQYFVCGVRSAGNQEVRAKIRDQYQIEWLTDPFCHD
jgi:hypothetical protein